jgi:membrane dipeptidase
MDRMGKSTAVVLGLAVPAVLLVGPASPGQFQVSPRAKALHAEAIVLDTHDDTTQRLIYDHFDISKRHPDGHIDIPRMREGGLGGLFFSIWVPTGTTGPEAVKKALDQIDAVREAVGAHSGDLMLATTAAEVREAHRLGKIAALMGMEGGHMIDDDLGVLRLCAALGVRYLTLTHTRNTSWADSSADTPAHNGLTPFGREVVRELNRLGVMVDISHVSDKTFWDALDASRAPIIASHSSLRAICDHRRNVTDEMVKALAAKGGVVQINFCAEFISQERRNALRELGPAADQAGKEADKRCGGNDACAIREEERWEREQVAAGKLPPVGWERIVEHIDRAVRIAGADHVGLGSDFDGASMPDGMEDVSQLPKITEALLRKGYSDADIRKILGGNLLRVMEEVERVSRQMQAGSGR